MVSALGDAQQCAVCGARDGGAGATAGRERRRRRGNTAESSWQSIAPAYHSTTAHSMQSLVQQQCMLCSSARPQGPAPATACCSLHGPQRRWAAAPRASAAAGEPQPSSSGSSSGGPLGALRRWQADSQRLRQQLQSLGFAGVVTYGLLNTAYYLTTFLVVWFAMHAPSGEQRKGRRVSAAGSRRRTTRSRHTKALLHAQAWARRRPHARRQR